MSPLPFLAESFKNVCSQINWKAMQHGLQGCWELRTEESLRGHISESVALCGTAQF